MSAIRGRAGLAVNRFAHDTAKYGKRHFAGGISMREGFLRWTKTRKAQKDSENINPVGWVFPPAISGLFKKGIDPFG